jgi:hypothetical protein
VKKPDRKLVLAAMALSLAAGAAAGPWPVPSRVDVQQLAMRDRAEFVVILLKRLIGWSDS